MFTFFVIYVVAFVVCDLFFPATSRSCSSFVICCIHIYIYIYTCVYGMLLFVVVRFLCLYISYVLLLGFMCLLF